MWRTASARGDGGSARKNWLQTAWPQLLQLADASAGGAHKTGLATEHHHRLSRLHWRRHWEVGWNHAVAEPGVHPHGISVGDDPAFAFVAGPPLTAPRTGLLVAQHPLPRENPLRRSTPRWHPMRNSGPLQPARRRRERQTVPQSTRQHRTWSVASIDVDGQRDHPFQCPHPGSQRLPQDPQQRRTASCHAPRAGSWPRAFRHV
mmetsp:Transcript_68834/g.153620  ORF Transcript_68834/g.153620 Transcript_68834/m.153620 type:complete len:204 (-) Transcript_68834:657-1268(-)